MRKPVNTKAIKILGDLAFPETCVFHTPDGRDYLVTATTISSHYTKFRLSGREIKAEVVEEGLVNFVEESVVNLGVLDFGPPGS